MAETTPNSCELCNNEATIYCPSDSAFLCSACDPKVHGANFLVARHVRSSICQICRNLAGFQFSGARSCFPAINSVLFCRICSPESFDCVVDDDVAVPESSSSSCVSSTTEVGDEAVSKRDKAFMKREKPRSGGDLAVDSKVEGILVNLCRKMAVDDRKCRRVVSSAVELLSGCLERMTVLPFRVALTASFWLALKMYGRDGEGVTCRDLGKVEKISRVPAKLILVTSDRLARVLKRRRPREDHVEGWAEC